MPEHVHIVFVLALLLLLILVNVGFTEVVPSWRVLMNAFIFQPLACFGPNLSSEQYWQSPLF